ncbi:hypothetical protein TNCT_254931 [Trichonephila clavata]|uniref:Uncharacterized protein n=1 Tax=Trichonephila clavata TaxID=2740835 RepID=A0A8X6LSW6_TRICU|nr:hypothetical protein TNCT_254931 [Trichonephila clavata]
MHSSFSREKFQTCCGNCLNYWFQCCLPDEDHIEESSSFNQNRELSPQIPPIVIHQLSNFETVKDLPRPKIPRVSLLSSRQMQASSSKSGMADEIGCKSVKTNITKFTPKCEAFIDTNYNNQKSNNTLTTKNDYAKTIRNGNTNINCIATIPEKIMRNKFIPVPLHDLRPKVNQKLNDKDSENTRFMEEKATQYQQIQNIESLIDERTVMFQNDISGNRGKKISKCITGRSNDLTTSLFKYDRMQYISKWIQENNETNFSEAMSNKTHIIEPGIRNQYPFRRYGKQHEFNEGMNFNANSPVRDRFDCDRHFKRKGMIVDHSQGFILEGFRSVLTLKLYPELDESNFSDEFRSGKKHCKDMEQTTLGIAPNHPLLDTVDFGYIIGAIGSKLIESRNVDYKEPGKQQMTNNISVASSIKFGVRKNVDPKKNQDAILRDKALTMEFPKVRPKRKSLKDQNCSKSYIRSSESGTSVHYKKRGSNLKTERNFKDDKNSLRDTSSRIKCNERKMSRKPFKETKINENCELLKGKEEENFDFRLDQLQD